MQSVSTHKYGNKNKREAKLTYATSVCTGRRHQSIIITIEIRSQTQNTKQETRNHYANDRFATNLVYVSPEYAINITTERNRSALSNTDFMDHKETHEYSQMHHAQREDNTT